MDFALLSAASAAPLLLALPALLVPYLFRRRARRIVVPSLFLYEGLAASARQGMWGRLRLSPLFFLHLLILLLLILIAARPVVRSPGGSVAFVLDTSASMQARAPDGAARVFELAKRALGPAWKCSLREHASGCSPRLPLPKRLPIAAWPASGQARPWTACWRESRSPIRPTRATRCCLFFRPTAGRGRLSASGLLHR